jgi:hypothetical protein
VLAPFELQFGWGLCSVCVGYYDLTTQFWFKETVTIILNFLTIYSMVCVMLRWDFVVFVAEVLSPFCLPHKENGVCIISTPVIVATVVLCVWV